jgi:hypothetical protein
MANPLFKDDVIYSHSFQYFLLRIMNFSLSRQIISMNLAYGRRGIA